MKLFAVYLGGRAPKANTELHDVVFAVGARIEDTYTQLLDKWFGDPVGLHIDSWLELDVVDGWRVSLTQTPSPSDAKLFFVNLGAYDHTFTELHAMGFYVASGAPEAKQQALSKHANDGVSEVHKDDLHAVDDCIALETVSGLRVTLTKTSVTSTAKPNNGYHIIPKDVVTAHIGR
ncbi:MAG TPA: DUF1543 domain-containing protein [Rhizomicrobium sp.]|nr:DUF1543 domain-containing protein [Rhizomicrobium sp.]